MILLTAFEPFGNEESGTRRRVNVSKQALQALRQIYGNSLRYLVMSVDDACREQFDLALEAAAWEGIILMGEAGDGGPVRIERQASDPADESASRVRMSRAATPDTAECCGAALTHQIGRYYCNAIYYHALGHYENAVFVHLPKQRPHSEHVRIVRKLIEALRTPGSGGTSLGGMSEKVG